MRKCDLVNKYRIMNVVAIASAAILMSGCGNNTDKAAGAADTQITAEEETSDETTAINDNADDAESDESESDSSIINEESDDSEGASDGESEDMAETIPILKDCVKQKMGCRFGCAITGQEPWDIQLWNLVTEQFNCVTLGNELKPDSLFGYSNEVCPGTEEVELNGEMITVPVLNFKNPEKVLNKILKWNEANPDKSLQVRGHVLLWHSQTPEWFFHEDYDKTKPYVSAEEMDKRQEWYIKSVLQHFTGEDSQYKDLFYGWDVVNEAISDATGTYRTDTENPDEDLLQDTHGNNSSWWHVYQNESFIINAFKYANKYAPETLELYYNDYNECDAKKRAGIIELLQAIKDAEGAPGEGTRITAMGMQGHYGVNGPSNAEIETSAKAYGKIVGNVQITEWDMRASDEFDSADAELVEKEYEKQRKMYNLQYYGLWSAQNSGEVKVTGMTFWGTVDKCSWLQFRSNVGGGNKTGQSQCPLLFDNFYKPKPCFYVFAATE